MKYFILIFFILLTFSSVGQTGIYRTYEDYKNGNIESYSDDYSNRTYSSFGSKMVFKKENGKKVHFKMKEFWGFLYKGVLFRSITDGYGIDNIVAVADSGKFIFYVNGDATRSQLKNNSEYGSYNVDNAGVLGGVECYLSENLNSKIYFMPWNSYSTGMFKNQVKRYKDFQHTYPQYQALYDCIGDTYSSLEARKCIKKFN